MEAASRTLPNTQCLPSNHSHLLQVMKNWQPLVLGPLLAMDRSPGPVCRRSKFSSAKPPLEDLYLYGVSWVGLRAVGVVGCGVPYP